MTSSVKLLVSNCEFRLRNFSIKGLFGQPLKITALVYSNFGKSLETTKNI